jgi:hypothetical protein
MATQFMPIGEVEESFGDPIADSTGSEDGGIWSSMEMGSEDFWAESSPPFGKWRS